jgi:adenylate kinase family enzyme
MLDATRPLPHRPNRIIVAGTSGSGKTTVAGQIGALVGIPHLDLDGLFHGPDWVPRQSFLTDVERFTAGPRWVTEWQYDSARPLLAERADLMVWLDLPRAVVMRQVILRTVSRRVRRQELWNGNYEPPFRAFFTDREHIVRWAWRMHAPDRFRVVSLCAQQPELTVVQLRSRKEISDWLGGPLLASQISVQRRSNDDFS